MIHSKQSQVSMESIKKGRMTSCSDIHQLLPENVVIEILLRLPVNSLIRARAVCKNWYTIIINPSFVSEHYDHPSNSARLFVHRYDEISSGYAFSLFPDQTLAGYPPAYQNVVVDMFFYMDVSLYNGILCLSSRNQSKGFALWNPATREFRSLPVFRLNFPPDVVIFKEIFGFGLDPITNDYKVVWIWDTLDSNEAIRGPYQAAVYTLSTDSWRYLGHVATPYTTIYNPQSNTCINGVHYWRTTNKENDHPLILSFDMGNELFHNIRDIPSSHGVLASYNNSLALIDADSRPFVDIWVMREEGCWTKLFTFEIIRGVDRPLGFWKNGQLFMESDDGFMTLYDPVTHEIKDLGTRFIADDPLLYRESLVPIRGRNGFLEQDQLSDVDQVLNFSNEFIYRPLHLTKILKFLVCI
ncbi:putative F-box protein At3g16210 [Cornus florida]|uniref:putative F-box protein At3g16210 n=1 Tax=Cornus florida TaxID=4283 RepID=UPI0028A0A5DB|nr:putative F-box protein At3g16210 [Cornus florida]